MNGFHCPACGTAWTVVPTAQAPLVAPADPPKVGAVLEDLIPQVIARERFRGALDTLGQLLGHKSRDWRADCRTLGTEALAHFLVVGCGVDGNRVLAAMEASK